MLFCFDIVPGSITSPDCPTWNCQRRAGDIISWSKDILNYVSSSIDTDIFVRAIQNMIDNIYNEIYFNYDDCCLLIKLKEIDNGAFIIWFQAPYNKDDINDDNFSDIPLFLVHTREQPEKHWGYIIFPTYPTHYDISLSDLF